MARSTKQLKMNLYESKENCNKYSIHLDRVDNTLSIEHYDYYLICKLKESSKTRSSRIYLSYKHKAEYCSEKAKTNLAYKRLFPQSQNELFDIDEKYIDLIKDFIDKKLCNEILFYEQITSILNGFRLYIHYLISKQTVYSRIDEIIESNLEDLYSYYTGGLDENINNKSILDIDTFLKTLGLYTKKYNKFKKQINKKNICDNKNEISISISSDIIYQLATYIKEEFQNTSKIVNEYYSWLEELNPLNNPANSSCI